MRVAQLGEQGDYRFFYVTNRAREAGEASLEEPFGRERHDGLEFGRFDAVIEPSLGLGMLINPTQWLQNEEIDLTDVRSLEREAFVDELRALVEASPMRSLLIVVHGYREAFPSALRKTAFLGHVLDLDSPVLLFDWPGNQGSSLRGYRRAHEVASASGAELAQTLDLIAKEVAPERIWLIANSMGAQVAADAFEALYRDSDWADAETELEDVVLTAPDVDGSEFDEHFAPMMNALARDLTVYVSSNDRALLMSRIVNRGRRAGESTLSPDQLDEAIALSGLVEASDGHILLVDVTPVNRTRNFHNFSLETPEFFDDLYLRITNDRMPQSRSLYQKRTADGAYYWVLTRGR
jgi:esterase/lipase superfamily enzyme